MAMKGIFGAPLETSFPQERLSLGAFMSHLEEH
jgi:hypothetical protein